MEPREANALRADPAAEEMLDLLEQLLDQIAAKKTSRLGLKAFEKEATQILGELRPLSRYFKDTVAHLEVQISSSNTEIHEWIERCCK